MTQTPIPPGQQPSPLSVPVAVVIPCLYGGGAERAALALAEELSETFRTTLIRLETGDDYTVPKSINTCVLSDTDGRAGPWQKIFAVFRQFWRLRHTLTKNKIVCCVAFTERPCLLLALVKISGYQGVTIASFRNHQSGHIAQERISGFTKIIRAIAHKLAIKLSAKFCTHLVSLSKTSRADLIENFGTPATKITNIYNSYRIDRLQALSTESADVKFEGLCGDRFCITTMGRIERQKGQAYLLRAYDFFRKQLPDHAKSILVILGKGALTNDLQSLCKTMRLPHSNNFDEAQNWNHGVVFAGFQKNPYAFVARGHIFAFPSLWEGFGNALVEAMACGSAVIAADCLCGPREILAPDSALLHQTESAESAAYGLLMPSFRHSDSPRRTEQVAKIWSESFFKLWQNPDELAKLKAAAREGAGQFSFESTNKAWTKLIQKLICE